MPITQDRLLAAVEAGLEIHQTFQGFLSAFELALDDTSISREGLAEAFHALKSLHTPSPTTVSQLMTEHAVVKKFFRHNERKTANARRRRLKQNSTETFEL